MVRIAEMDSPETGDIHLNGTKQLPGAGRKEEERSAGTGRLTPVEQ